MSTFTDLFNGTLYGVMRWEQWDIICEEIRSENEWYLYAIGQGVPDTLIVGTALSYALDEISALLKRDHEEDYLGIVYVDNFSHPTLVKIYDPNNLGASCGSSGNETLLRWILSLHLPSLITSDIPVPNNRGAGGKNYWLNYQQRKLEGVSVEHREQRRKNPRGYCRLR